MSRDTSLLLPGNAGYLLLQPFFDAASAAIRQAKNLDLEGDVEYEQIDRDSSHASDETTT